VVKESALQWGFWHLGHFAGSYRDIFGESPSETVMGRAG
jgi:AraC family ethanolamine operon transcriptional activator